ncbi:MAG TPA: hypothetical protein VF794_29485 [Archangium sp.]|jgi:hypothetical protein|uniref:hypothetical protein n=1 Tax=Archangium sp. TaxID=1872627 RepID=UPI002EDA0AD9
MSLPALFHGWSLALLAASGVSEEPRPLMRPGNLDLRLDGAASLLPLSLEAGATLEVGVLPIGPGTLSLGAEASVNQCALACWVPNLFSERDVSRRDFYAVGRLGYHFTVADRNYRKVDLYGFLLAGAMEVHTSQTAPDYRYEGRSRSPAFGLGIGGNSFPTAGSRFFLGGEARVRFGTGAFDLTLTRGAYDFTEKDRRWLRLGLSTAFFVGVRLF